MAFSKSNFPALLFLAGTLSLSLGSNFAAALVIDQLPPLDTGATTSLTSTTTTPIAPSSTTAAATTTTTTPPVLPPESTTTIYHDLFPDLKVGNQYYMGVKYLKDLGLIQGYPDGKFQPLREVNRAEALKLLTGAIKFHSMDFEEKPLVNLEASVNASTQTAACPFPDLDKSAWFYSFVCSAFTDQVVAGYPDGTFQPGQTINRVEALKMDILQAGLSTQTATAENFDDVKITDWFNDYARLANQRSFMIEDRSGNLNPSVNMNRGDFAMLIYRTIRSIINHSEFGNATYYGGRFDGQTTASGETFQTSSLPTAAHKTLPFGTIVKVTNLTNGKTVVVRINDRGPYVNGAIIDLSTAAFKEIDSLSTGVVPAEVEIISQP